jgi:tetratricopeptide (TPR) repeat protein
MRVAQEQGDVETVGWTHSFSAWLAYFAGEPDAVYAHAQQLVEIAERIGDSFSRSWAWLWLGWAQLRRGELAHAIESLERSLSISREHRSGVEGDAIRLAALAESYLGVGEPAKARALVEEAIASATEGRSQLHQEIDARLAQARILRTSGDEAEWPEAERALARALEVVRTIGENGYKPLIHVELAELAGAMGDEEGRQRELREAHRQFTENGATGHADRLAGELELISS